MKFRPGTMDDFPEAFSLIRALILDSAFFQTEAHAFYEHNGFAKDCYSFET